jgi:hypothetical protein
MACHTCHEHAGSSVVVVSVIYFVFLLHHFFMDRTWDDVTNDKFYRCTSVVFVCQTLLPLLLMPISYLPTKVLICIVSIASRSNMLKLLLFSLSTFFSICSLWSWNGAKLISQLFLLFMLLEIRSHAVPREKRILFASIVWKLCSF